jgi:hypothetical protein
MQQHLLAIGESGFCQDCRTGSVWQNCTGDGAWQVNGSLPRFELVAKIVNDDGYARHRWSYRGHARQGE